MGHQGFCVMLHELFSNKKDAAEKYYGKQIQNAEIIEDELIITFSDGIKVAILDDGQSCCEERYMTCDDDVNDLIGNELRAIQIKDGGEKEDNYESYEWAFVDIVTDKSVVQLCTHNKHNGYYGGFAVSIKEIPHGNKVQPLD